VQKKKYTKWGIVGMKRLDYESLVMNFAMETKSLQAINWKPKAAKNK